MRHLLLLTLLVAAMAIAQDGPLIDRNAPMKTETATFALG